MQSRMFRRAIREHVDVRNASDPFPWKDGSFDLALSINSLHSVPLPGLRNAGTEMERVAVDKQIVVALPDCGGVVQSSMLGLHR